MTRINANQYGATTEAVAGAIARSKSHTEIVTIEAGGQALDAIVRELETECEDCVTGNAGVREYWGVDIEGTEWRVHVRPAGGES